MSSILTPSKRKPPTKLTLEKSSKSKSKSNSDEKRQSDIYLQINTYNDNHQEYKHLTNNVSIYYSNNNDNKLELVKRVPIKSKQNIYNEVKITQVMHQSKYTPNLLHTYTDGTYNYLVFDYDRNMIDLEEYILSGHPNQNNIERKLLKIVDDMHTIGIVHLDLKLKNFIINQDNSKIIKIIDFGVSHILNTPIKYRPIGTVLYAEPDLFFSRGEFRSKKWIELTPERLIAIDYWAVGICILLLNFPHLIREYSDHISVAQFINNVITRNFKTQYINTFIDTKLFYLLHDDWKQRRLRLKLANGNSANSASSGSKSQ